MTDYLYVCEFSNGHIKVGRSVEPAARIADHEDRVSVMGITLVQHHMVPCEGVAFERETNLIGQCASKASQQFKNEWFVGLDYLEVCQWAEQQATAAIEPCDTVWARRINAIVARGVAIKDIAKNCGCTPAAISQLRRGQIKEPSYTIGAALVEMAGV